MKLLAVLIIASILVAYIECIPHWQYPGRCRSVSDCPCGSQCISRFSNAPCGRGGWGRFCVCRRGCVVGNIFMRPGSSNPNTYCNTCRCPANTIRSRGIPACSRRRWCGVPRPVYPTNPNCP